MAFKMSGWSGFKKQPIRKVTKKDGKKIVEWTNPITGKTRTKVKNLDTKSKHVTTNLYGGEGNIKVKNKKKGEKL